MARTKYIVDNDEAEQKIRDIKPFRNRTGSLRGVLECAEEFGHLPDKYREQASDAVYVVYSCRTPIAWVTADGDRVIPDVGYSPTTGQHQYIVKAAWRETGYTGSATFPARGREVVKIPATDEQYGRARRLRRGGIDGHPDPEDWAHGEDAFRRR